MKFKHKKKVKITYIIVMIFILSFSILKNISSSILYHVENVVIKNVDRSIYNCIFFTFSNEKLGNKALLDVIILHKDGDGKVVSVDYNYDIMYEHLSSEMELLYKNIDSIELDGYDKDKKGIYYFPVGLSYNNILLENLGFKIPIKIEFIHDIDMGLKAKVRNYGVNNILIELYVVIDIKSNIMSPSSYKGFSNSYEIVVASKIVIGEIPFYVGDSIEKSTAILTS